MKRETTTVKIGEQEISFETGKIAKQANGAVIVRSGDTMVFSSACATKEQATQTDFLPLRVDYQEKLSAAGKTLGGYLKREGRPTEKETLVCRLIDRPIRPMFEEGYFQETQVPSYVWSYDGINSPEPLAICAASAALTISDIPLIKPVGAVRVGMIDGNFILNPTLQQQEKSVLDLLIAGTDDAVLMIEGYCDFLSEEKVLEAIECGHEGIKKICHTLTEWQKVVGKTKDRSTLIKGNDALISIVKTEIGNQLESALKIQEKLKREEALSELREKIIQKISPESDKEPEFPADDVKKAFKKVQASAMREMILSEGIRSDGRSVTEIRPIDIEQGLLPRAHGSCLFTRGETQAVAVATLGPATMAQRFESLDGDGAREFYLQYSFPPFSVGEVGRVGPPGRREVGHGKLAERALQAALPPKEAFPYTIRVESNITESNGSSSMASVCGGCIAMMNAGVPIKRPVSGIAMGLILEGERFAILSDILGIEDSLGDMDFKITGDHEGITAFQMDIKVEGITVAIMQKALNQAKAGREHILNIMEKACPEPSALSTYAPRLETVNIPPSKIGAVIGKGGEQIRAIVEETGVEIDIDDDGKITLSSPNGESIERAKAIIKGLTADVEVGKIYEGLVKSIKEFGIFVELLPGKEGLCHISEFDHSRIDDLTKHIKTGQTVRVKVLDINERGQIKLSRKVLLEK